LLTTERLLLRKPVPGDADGVRSYASDPEVMRFLAGAPEGDFDAVEVVARWLARWDANGFGQLVVTSREDGSFLGRTGLLVWDRDGWKQSTLRDAADPEIELGWTFVREHWGRGYATEAARAARAWAVETVGVERLISLISPLNARSVRVAERLGATPVESVELGGEPADVWLHTGC
jgi:RimJ/RimL family protein N-acetyltransferase